MPLGHLTLQKSLLSAVKQLYFLCKLGLKWGQGEAFQKLPSKPRHRFLYKIKIKMDVQNFTSGVTV